MVQCVELEVWVQATDGKTLFRRHLSISPQQANEYVTHGSGGFSLYEVHFLVTGTGIYPIPTRYRESWQARFDEIVSQTLPRD